MSRDRTVGETFFIAFTTRAFATGIPTTLAGTPVVSAYEDAGLTQITAGITLGVDHDGVAGLNLLTIVATGANGFEAGKDYQLVITTGTVGGVSVVGEVIGQFSLGLSAAFTRLGAPAGASVSVDIADLPTVAEFNARTIPAADYFDPDEDTVANVTDVATTAVNTDMRGTDSAFLAASAPVNFSALGISVGGAIDDVTLVATTTTNTDQRGTDGVDTATMRGTDSAALASALAVAQADLDIITGAAGALLDSTATSAQLVDDVWDEILTGATHNIPQSSGRRLRALSGLIIEDGTLQSATANTAVLEVGDVTVDDQFRRSKILITANLGAGQEAIITSSVASTDTLTITPAWLVTPDATSEYEILPAQSHSTVANGGYEGGQVFVDANSSNTGTEIGVDGTSTNPVNNLADAYVILAQENLFRISVAPESNLTLPSDSSCILFDGSKYTIALNGQEIGGSSFQNCIISGIGLNTSGSNPVFLSVAFADVTLPPCNGATVGFFGTFTIGSPGNFTFGGSSEVFNQTLTLDYGVANNASQFFLVGWLGGSVEIQNAGAGTGSYRFELNGTGQLVVNANCSATTEVVLSGTISRNADVAGIVYTEDSNSVDLIGVAADTDIATDIANVPAAVLAAGDVDGFSLEEAQKLILAASVGILAGAATNSITIQAADGSKTRITATVDADGNRSAVAKDVTG